MKFYISGDTFARLKNDITNINSYKIIDVDWILKTCGLDSDNPVHGYIISSEIKRMISEGLKNKKYSGIIYLNSRLDAGLVYSIKSTLLDIMGCDIVDINLFDDRDVPKYKDLYKLFDGVIFYSRCKKMKLIECKPIIPKKMENKKG